MGTDSKCLIEALVMSTHNICFLWEIRKVATFLLKRAFAAEKVLIFFLFLHENMF